jgi:hypothetical protein
MARTKRTRRPGRGLPADAGGGPTVDPTQNVKDLSEASNIRQDDLRDLTKELFDVNVAHVKELGALRASHQRELSKAESERLNAIRQVDREEVAKSAVTANTAITTLAKQTTDLQTTLQKQTADIAVAVEQRQSAFASDTNKRLSAVELALSEGKGKQQVADPQIDRMALMVEKLVAAQATGTGKSEGLSQGWAILGGAILLALAIYSGVFKSAAPAPIPVLAPAPQVIVVPSAAGGVTLPVTPPQSVRP